MEKFTLEKVLEIQASHLAQWKTVLKDEVYEKLETIVKNMDKKNKDRIERDPYSVCWGSNISCIVSNLSAGNYDTYKDYLWFLKTCLLEFYGKIKQNCRFLNW